MLVLTRKQDQQIVIPDLNITVKVIRCKGSRVTLGFEAPSDVRIVRGELEIDTATEHRLGNQTVGSGEVCVQFS